MHGINVKTYYGHETNTLPMTDHMTKETEHQAVRRYLVVVKDRKPKETRPSQRVLALGSPSSLSTSHDKDGTQTSWRYSRKRSAERR